MAHKIENTNVLKDVIAQANDLRFCGWTVEINCLIPYVAISGPDDQSFYCQGDEALRFIENTPKNVSLEDWALYSYPGQA